MLYASKYRPDQIISGSNVQKVSFLFILLQTIGSVCCSAPQVTPTRMRRAQDAGPTYRRVRLRTWFSKRKRLSDCLNHLFAIWDIFHSVSRVSSQQQLYQNRWLTWKFRKKMPTEALSTSVSNWEDDFSFNIQHFDIKWQVHKCPTQVIAKLVKR